MAWQLIHTWFSERVLREAGLLWHEHQSGALHEDPARPGEQRRLQQRHQLEWDVLHHAAHRRLLCRRLPGEVLDHRQLHDHLHFRKIVARINPCFGFFPIAMI